MAKKTAEQLRREEQMRAQEEFQRKEEAARAARAAREGYPVDRIVQYKSQQGAPIPPPTPEESEPAPDTAATPDAPYAVIPGPSWRVPQVQRPNVLEQLTQTPEFQERINSYDQGPQVVPRFGAPLPMEQLLQARNQGNAYIDQMGNVFPINRQMGDTANYASHTITPEGVKLSLIHI